MGLRRECCGVAPLALTLLMGVSALAQSPTYGVGRTPTPEEIRAWDISIGPTGEELPPGRGTAKEGAQFYRSKGCAGCHGATGIGGTAPILKSKAGPETDALGTRTNPAAALAVRDDGVGLHQSRHAAQQRGDADRRRGLRADGVSALHQRCRPGGRRYSTPQSLPKVKMPIGDRYASLPEWKPRTPRLKGYPY